MQTLLKSRTFGPSFLLVISSVMWCVGWSLPAHGLGPGQTPPPALSISPVEPTIRDPIHVTLTRFVGGCVVGPTSYQVIIVADVVTIEHTYPAGASSLAGGTCKDQVTIPPLQGGVHRLEWKEGVENVRLGLEASIALFVSGAAPLPIPTLQPPLIAALIALLVFFAARPAPFVALRSEKSVASEEVARYGAC